MFRAEECAGGADLYMFNSSEGTEGLRKREGKFGG